MHAFDGYPLGGISQEQCHCDGGCLPSSGKGSFGVVVTTWHYDDDISTWQRKVKGTVCGSFKAYAHSHHAELVALSVGVGELKRILIT